MSDYSLLALRVNSKSFCCRQLIDQLTILSRREKNEKSDGKNTFVHEISQTIYSLHDADARSRVSHSKCKYTF